MANNKQKAKELFEKIQQRKNEKAGNAPTTQSGVASSTGKGVNKNYARNQANRSAGRSELGRSKKV